MAQGSVRVAYHHGQLREAVLASALEALDARGALPSLREIAATCGVSHAALYRHFASQEALALELAAICFRDMAAAIQERFAAVEDPVARLRAGCAASVAWGLAHRGRYLFMMSADLAGKQKHAAFLAAAHEAFDPLVAAVAAVGVAEPVPVAQTVLWLLHGFTDFTCKGRTVPFPTASLDRQIDRLLAAVVGYVVAQASAGR
jgi:AcrR family transcriptional regulator